MPPHPMSAGEFDAFKRQARRLWIDAEQRYLTCLHLAKEESRKLKLVNRVLIVTGVIAAAAGVSGVTDLLGPKVVGTVAGLAGAVSTFLATMKNDKSFADKAQDLSTASNSIKRLQQGLINHVESVGMRHNTQAPMLYLEQFTVEVYTIAENVTADAASFEEQAERNYRVRHFDDVRLVEPAEVVAGFGQAMDDFDGDDLIDEDLEPIAAI